MTAPQAPQIKGWRVIMGTQSEKQRALGSWKWEPASRVFTVRSAADEFRRIAERDTSGVAFEIETVYVR